MSDQTSACGLGKPSEIENVGLSSVTTKDDGPSKRPSDSEDGSTSKKFKDEGCTAELFF